MGCRLALGHPVAVAVAGVAGDELSSGRAVAASDGDQPVLGIVVVDGDGVGAAAAGLGPGVAVGVVAVGRDRRGGAARALFLGEPVVGIVAVGGDGRQADGWRKRLAQAIADLVVNIVDTIAGNGTEHIGELLAR